MLNVLNKPLSKMTDSELKSNISNQEIPNKEIILKYMQSFDKCAFTSQPVIDRVTGEKFNCANDARTDGIYRWYEYEIYHFEKYNLKLNDDFIQHILNRL